MADRFTGSWIEDRVAALQPVKYLFTLKPDAGFLAQADAYRHARGIEAPKSAHLTLALFQAHQFYSPERLAEDLEAIAEETPGFKVSMRGWDVFKDLGTGDDLLVLRAQYAEELKMLHMNIGASIVKPNIYQGESRGPDTQEENLVALIERRYGSRFFGPRYQPHMTFGKLSGAKPESDDFHGIWLADRIYVSCKQDGWQDLASFPLAKPF